MQEIVNIRIDERLIHGQVASYWTNFLKATRIMVVDDSAAKDEIQKMALKMACPPGVKLSILPVEKAANNIAENKYDGDRILMVMKGPEVLMKLWDFNFRPEIVNVGNMSSGIGTKQVKRSVNVTEKDVQDFTELNSRGMKFTAQMVPSEENIDFMKLIK